MKFPPKENFLDETLKGYTIEPCNKLFISILYLIAAEWSASSVIFQEYVNSTTGGSHEVFSRLCFYACVLAIKKHEYCITWTNVAVLTAVFHV